MSEEKSELKKLAEFAIMPEHVAITGIKKFVQPNSDFVSLFSAMLNQAEKIEAGDLSRIERHLYSQALALNSLCDCMLKKLATSCSVNEGQLYGQMALKAQAQSRATFIALADLKNPNKATFIKQQNNAINQQVNNQLTTETSENSTTCRTELISEETHETLDFSGTPENNLSSFKNGHRGRAQQAL